MHSILLSDAGQKSREHDSKNKQSNRSPLHFLRRDILHRERRNGSGMNVNVTGEIPISFYNSILFLSVIAIFLSVITTLVCFVEIEKLTEIPQAGQYKNDAFTWFTGRSMNQTTNSILVPFSISSRNDQRIHNEIDSKNKNRRSVKSVSHNSNHKNPPENQHHHAIPNTIIFTHNIDLLNTVFQFNNENTSLSDDEKELLTLQGNVRNIVKLHPSSNVQFLTNSDCVSSIRTMMKNLTKHETSNKTEELIEYFNNEKKGMFKADLCRGAALYQNGGLYFDVDIGARMNLWSVIRQETEFVTVRVHKQSNHKGAFFQAFIGATSHHPILKRYVELFYMYYKGTISHKDHIDGGPLGVLLLKRAYDEIKKENHTKILVDSNQERDVQVQLYQDTKNDREILEKVVKPRDMDLKTELWQEILYLPDFQHTIFKNVPYPYWGTRRACKFVVVVSIEENHPLIVPFYSRVAGSRMCPSSSTKYTMDTKNKSSIGRNPHHRRDHKKNKMESNHH